MYLFAPTYPCDDCRRSVGHQQHREEEQEEGLHDEELCWCSCTSRLKSQDVEAVGPYCMCMRDSPQRQMAFKLMCWGLVAVYKPNPPFKKKKKKEKRPPLPHTSLHKQRLIKNTKVKLELCFSDRIFDSVNSRVIQCKTIKLIIFQAVCCRWSRPGQAAFISPRHLLFEPKATLLNTSFHCSQSLKQSHCAPCTVVCDMATRYC